MKKCTPVTRLLTKSSLCILVILCSTTLSLMAKRPAAQLLEKKITLRMEQSALYQALDRIGTAANISFSYAVSKEVLSSRVSINARNQKVSLILKKILDPFALEYFAADDKVIIRHEADKINTPPLTPRATTAAVTKPLKGR